MNYTKRYALAVLCLTGFLLSAQNRISETTTSTETITTRTVSTETQRTETLDTRPLKICVLDFSNADIAGQKRFLSGGNKKIDVPPQCTLNDADRKSINSVMQGFVRMIDAWDSSKSNTANRVEQIADNRFERTKALELYQKTVNGPARPMVIGAEYLSSFLGKHNEVFHLVPQELVLTVMNDIQKAPDFPKDFMRKIAQRTGATHLIYTTVSDPVSETKTFQGYGIETKNTIYTLDVLIKVADLARQRIVYSGVYTGQYRIQVRPGAATSTSDLYQTLMKSALEQAAEELCRISKPGRDRKIFPAK